MGDSRPLTLRKDGSGTAPASGGGPGAGDLEQDSSSAAYIPGADDGGGRAGRLWATRRLPAALVAVVLLAAAALLLYDVVAVRLDRPGMAWRRELADELASRPIDDVWVRVGAVAAVVLGLWLLAGALTPGLRGLLPMRREYADVRAALERSAAALVLRDRAMEVSGVQAARVKVGRRRVRARAQAHFRELDEVRAELDSALGEGIRELGVARRHRLSVRVRRPKR
ncbi:hypothetical protein E4198_22435 [Streptomyces sp. RKND-216]|nr:hypothetical protein E4198_22435 [Streptomyces sp. RKND-216]